MSCGSAEPSTTSSPRLTTWPSCTRMFFSLATSSSCTLPSGSVICRRFLPLVSLPKRHRAGDLGQRADVLRAAGLEQLGHPRQAAGDVARLLAFHRDARQHLAGRQVLAVADLDQRADREADRHRVVGAGDLDLDAGGVQQLDLRAHHLGRAAALRVDDHQRRQARDLVDLLGHGDAFLDVLELRPAGELGDDRTRQRIPVGQHRAGLELLVGLDVQRRAVRHLVALALAAMRVGDRRSRRNAKSPPVRACRW